MGWRYRRRIKLLPGIYLNISKSGISTNFGIKGANVTFCRKGTYVNTGIPGTGLYRRDKVAGCNAKDVYLEENPTETYSLKESGNQETLHTTKEYDETTFFLIRNTRKKRHATPAVSHASKGEIPQKKKPARVTRRTFFHLKTVKSVRREGGVLRSPVPGRRSREPAPGSGSRPCGRQSRVRARRLHPSSRRSAHPFLPVPCSSGRSFS